MSSRQIGRGNYVDGPNSQGSRIEALVHEEADAAGMPRLTFAWNYGWRIIVKRRWGRKGDSRGRQGELRGMRGLLSF
jgi:hypothetical protein